MLIKDAMAKVKLEIEPLLKAIEEAETALATAKDALTRVQATTAEMFERVTWEPPTKETLYFKDIPPVDLGLNWAPALEPQPCYSPDESLGPFPVRIWWDGKWRCDPPIPGLKLKEAKGWK